jgi:cyanophycin synthetase
MLGGIRARVSSEAERAAALTDLARHVGPRQLARDRLRRRRYDAVSQREGERFVARMWEDAAGALGAELRRCSPTVLEFRLGDAHAYVTHAMTTSFADRVSGELVLDKPLTLGLLSDAGLPVPRHTALERSERTLARDFLERIGGFIVVKPAHGAGGGGVVGHVANAAQLDAALRSSGRYNRRVLLEEQLPGDAYRLTLLDGKLLDVVRREHPTIIGDGCSTIAELIGSEYERRISSGGDTWGFKPLELDLDCLFTLAAAGLEPASVPPAGAAVRIRTASNFSGPERSFTAGDQVTAELVEVARRAAEVVNMRLAGVDVVLADASGPLEASGALLEVNAPGLHHHYNVADRSGACAIAVPILAALLGVDEPGGAREGARRTPRP